MLSLWIVILSVGVVCFGSYGLYLGITGFGSGTTWVWFFMTFVSLFWIIAIKLEWPQLLPTIIRKIGIVVIVLGVVLFSIFQFQLIREGVGGYEAVRSKEVEVLIILGARVHSYGPSLMLKYRLDQAYEYAMSHPKVMVIVSGGQGVDEPCTEASTMAKYLIDKGFPKTRLLEESKSTTTEENLLFTRQTLLSGNDLSKSSIAILTNDFHVFRTKLLSHKLGFDATLMSAPSYKWLLPNACVREFMAYVRTFILS